MAETAICDTSANREMCVGISERLELKRSETVKIVPKDGHFPIFDKVIEKRL